MDPNKWEGLLMFLRAMFILSFALSIYGLVFLLPINIAVGRQDATSFYKVESASVTITADSYVLIWAEFLSLLYNLITCYVLFYAVYSRYYGFLRLQLNERTVNNFTVLIQNLDPSLTTVQLWANLSKLFPGKIFAIHHVPNALELTKASFHRSYIIEQLDLSRYKYARSMVRPRVVSSNLLRYFDCCGCLICFNRLDAISLYERKLVDVETQMNYLEYFLVNTSAAFVTFQDCLSAKICSSIFLEYSGQLLTATAAPDVSDVRWSSFRIHPWHRRISRWLVTAAVVVCGIFWCAFITFAQAIANIQYLSQLEMFSWLIALEENYPKIMNFISEFLPTILIVILFSAFRALLRVFVRMEYPITRSGKHHSYTCKLYFILIVNVFLASVITGTAISVFSQLVDLAENPISVLALLATRIPAQSGFFINYFALNSVLWNVSVVIQPVRLLKRIYISCCGVKTPIQRRWLHTPPWFHYQIEYSEQLLYFSILITFSSLAPLITPIGLLYYGSKWIFSRYFIFFMHKKRYEGFGSAWVNVFKYICSSIVIYQLIITGLFFIRSQIFLSIISAITIFVTIFYFNFVCNRFTVKDGRLINLQLPNGQEPPPPSHFHDSYRDPIFSWRIYITGFHRKSPDSQNDVFNRRIRYPFDLQSNHLHNNKDHGDGTTSSNNSSHPTIEDCEQNDSISEHTKEDNAIGDDDRKSSHDDGDTAIDLGDVPPIHKSSTRDHSTPT